MTTMPEQFAKATKEDIAKMHDDLADLHHYLAKTAILDVIHYEHAELVETLRADAKCWRDMRDDIFASKMGRKVAA